MFKYDLNLLMVFLAVLHKKVCQVKTAMIINFIRHDKFGISPAYH